jgi:hypothetical protein
VPLVDDGADHEVTIVLGVPRTAAPDRVGVAVSTRPP